jgi:hypothetical protein
VSELELSPRGQAPGEPSHELVAGGRSLNQIADSIRGHYTRGAEAYETAIDSYLGIGQDLLEAREQFASDKEFGHWFHAQRFPFKRTWAWTLQTASRHEQEVREVLFTQVNRAGRINIAAAVKAVRGTRRRPLAPVEPIARGLALKKALTRRAENARLGVWLTEYRRYRRHNPIGESLPDELSAAVAELDNAVDAAKTTVEAAADRLEHLADLVDEESPPGIFVEECPATDESPPLTETELHDDVLPVIASVDWHKIGDEAGREFGAFSVRCDLADGRVLNPGLWRLGDGAPSDSHRRWVVEFPSTRGYARRTFWYSGIQGETA